MGCRLRPRLLDRCRLLKIFVIVLMCILVFGHRHRAVLASHPHEIKGSASAAHELVAAISLGKRLTATDASQPQHAQTICKEQGLRVFNKRPVPRPGSGRSKRKVFDLLTTNTELDEQEWLDWLEIRLNSTYDFVDYFLIVGGNPFMVKQNWERFSPYHDKIIYHELEFAADFDSHRPGSLETHQRNAPFTQVFPNLIGEQSPTQGDVLLVSDVDEVVRPETLLVLRACETPRRLTLHSRLFYYSFQFLHRGMDWPHPQATTYQGMNDTILPDDLRKDDGSREWGYLAPVARWAHEGDLWNAGWYCSSCLPSVGQYAKTMESHMLVRISNVQERDQSAGQEAPREEFMNGRGEIFERIESNKDVPTGLGADTKRWWSLLDRERVSAGV